jgi:hypothetical protein
VRLQMARRHADDQPADPAPRTAASPDGRPLRPFQESPAMTSTCWFIAKRGNGLRTFRK